ncbi:MAG: tRNA uridine-5-carboxymethylaminomethyl(34) synthesis GTPase MnmE [Sphingomicrobium sp.]
MGGRAPRCAGNRPAIRLTGDTIFASSSGRPPAAIAVIRVSGPLAHWAGEQLGGSLPDFRTAAVRELRDPGDRALLDEALVLAFAAPATATGEDIVEFHCHGGRAVVDAVLGALSRIEGLRAAQPGEFTRRAFDHGRIDLTEAEGLADLLEAETETQRRVALALSDGSLKRQIAAWQKRLLRLSATAERSIDYADEHDEPMPTAFYDDVGGLAEELRSWLERPRLEPLKDGIRIVVAGPPNAGKSSLVNAIAGTDRAIVSAVPGTTRDYIEVPVALNGIAFLLTDTAGLRRSADHIEAIGVERAERLVEAADILLWLGAPADAPHHQRLVQLLPKADLGLAATDGSSLAVSAKTGQGLNPLIERIASLAAQFIPAENAVALNRRQAGLIGDAQAALFHCGEAGDVAIVADGLRSARHAFDRITGRAGVEDMLDALFARFCLGK